MPRTTVLERGAGCSPRGAPPWLAWAHAAVASASGVACLASQVAAGHHAQSSGFGHLLEPHMPGDLR